jgi:hypothetical protein
MDEVTEDISNIISEEEVQTFYSLLQKMNRAYAAIEKNNIENLEAQTNAPQSDENIPYEIVISVICDVNKAAKSLTLAPETLQNYKQTYVIDVITNNYEDIVVALLEEITSKLSEKCNKIIPAITPPKDQK